jgi:hypothetical protein
MKQLRYGGYRPGRRNRRGDEPTSLFSPGKHFPIVNLGTCIVRVPYPCCVHF